MLWFTVLAMWCACGYARGIEVAREKPFYPAAAHARHFEAFKATYNKQYATPEEERQRFEIFRNNLNSVNELNAKFKETVYGITKFSDLTAEEFVKRHTGLRVKNSSMSIPPTVLNVSSIEVPDTFDWRDKNVVTKVKNQGFCGSCWTFGILGCLESQYAIKYKKLMDLSEKQLVDCDTLDDGCMGGDYASAVSYIMSKGVMTEADYPYLDEEDECQYDPKKVAVRIKSYESFIGADEEVLKKYLYVGGPIAITINAQYFAHYKGGVFQDCKHYHIDHGVLLVGYGTENGVDYWLIKNSWGEEFGEEGYFKIQRGVTCLGISKAKNTEVMRVLL